VCEAGFALTRRRHECRYCRLDVCAGCSLQKRVLTDSATIAGQSLAVRVCDKCVHPAAAALTLRNQPNVRCVRDLDHFPRSEASAELVAMSVQISGLRGDVDAVLDCRGASKLAYFRVVFGDQVRGARAGRAGGRTDARRQAPRAWAPPPGASL
jgi:hypothetical protein